MIPLIFSIITGILFLAREEAADIVKAILTRFIK